MQKRNTALTLLAAFLFINSKATAQPAHNDVIIVGAMSNVMWKGELYGNINLDTLSQKTHLYGIGPVEYLKGEIVIVDGRSYRSTVLSDSTMMVEETFAIKAPFFGYAYISKWYGQDLPVAIQSMQQLEAFIDQATKTSKRPLLFKVTGRVDKASIHVVNLPAGAKVSSPDDAHKGQTHFLLTDEAVEIIGFFSTEHKSVFTHHDSNLHMHLLTADRKKMGHLDEVSFKKGSLKLFLPADGRNDVPR